MRDVYTFGVPDDVAHAFDEITDETRMVAEQVARRFACRPGQVRDPSVGLDLLSLLNTRLSDADLRARIVAEALADRRVASASVSGAATALVLSLVLTTGASASVAIG